LDRLRFSDSDSRLPVMTTTGIGPAGGACALLSSAMRAGGLTKQAAAQTRPKHSITATSMFLNSSISLSPFHCSPGCGQ
jgi:hypothetical protein